MTTQPAITEGLGLREMLSEPIVGDLMRRDGVTKRDILVALCQARRKRVNCNTGPDHAGEADGTWSEAWKRFS